MCLRAVYIHNVVFSLSVSLVGLRCFIISFENAREHGLHKSELAVKLFVKFIVLVSFHEDG